MQEKTIEIVYDHYKDTCAHNSEATKRRDRLMLFVVVALALLALQALSPVLANTTVADFLHFKFGVSLQPNLSIVGNVIWFLLMIFTVRYFQTVVSIERQYNYIHSIEDKINESLGGNHITREGKTYLNDYPYFSNWTYWLYMIIFPTLLFVVGTVKIFSELRSIYVVGWNYYVLLDFIFFLLFFLSIIFYLLAIHKKK